MVRANYIIYYVANNEPEGYSVSGYKNLREALKWLHSIKATDISIYKEGKDFETNQDDVLECYKNYWK